MEHFKRGRDAGWAVTVHAGEAGGAPSVWAALQLLGATRAGQATAARTDVEDLVLWDTVVVGERYVDELMRAPFSDPGPGGTKDPRATHPGLDWKYTREQVAAMTSFEAKRAGDLAEANMRKMNIDWVSFEGRRFPYRSSKPGEHYRLIVAATREKVRQNPEVRSVLLATGDLVLKPDHHQEPDAPPEWRYFEILTGIRTELRGQPQRSP